ECLVENGGKGDEQDGGQGENRKADEGAAYPGRFSDSLANPFVGGLGTFRAGGGEGGCGGEGWHKGCSGRSGTGSERVTAALPPLHVIDGEQQHERDDQRHGGDGGGFRILVLLEFGDDEQRCDFGFHGHVARDEHDGSVFTEGARETEREAGEQRRSEHGKDHLAEGLPSVGAERGGSLLKLLLEIL